jgi:hypothetical protein
MTEARIVYSYLSSLKRQSERGDVAAWVAVNNGKALDEALAAAHRLVAEADASPKEPRE